MISYHSVKDEVVKTYENAAEEQINAIINVPDSAELESQTLKAAFRHMLAYKPEMLSTVYQMMMQKPATGMDPQMIYTTLVTMADLIAESDEATGASAMINYLAMQDSNLMTTYLTARYKSVTAMSDEQINAFVSSLDGNTLFATFKNELAAEATASYKLSGASSQSSSKKDAKLAKAFLTEVEGGAYTDDELKAFYEDNKLVPKSSSSTVADNLAKVGYASKDDPSYISIYPVSFEDKELIADLIEQYNASQTDESDKISYTDYVGLIMSSVTSIINAITYVLIFFVSISLVVSSIMIGIITYISVLERTKEIGILRAIGASKKDVSRVFNAETLIVGFASGMIGIIVTVLLNIPIAIIIKHLSGISGLSTLPVAGGIILVLISMILTVIAGLIPSGIAAKKDPVESLRSE